MERFAINILHKRIYKICRLCGVDQPHKIPIIDGAETIIVGDEDEEASLAKKIEECVGIQVLKDDKMPQNICAICVDKINDFYEYRLMCAATNLQTRSILNLNLVEPSRKLLNFGEVSKAEDVKKEDVKKVMEVPTSSSSTTIPTTSLGKKGKKKRGPPSPSPSPAPTTRIKGVIDVKDEPVPAIPVKALTKKERLKQQQLQKEKDEQKKKEDEKKKKEGDKKDKKDGKLKKEKVEVKTPEDESKHTRSKRKEPSPAKETPEKVEASVPPPKKIKFEHPCSYCSDEFKTQEELDSHLSVKHAPLVRKFGCGSCRETFETVLESKDHNLWHQLTRTLYTCFKCKKKYDKNLALVKHMTLNACGRAARGKPPALLPDVQCRMCSKKFKTQNLYEWHGCFLKPKSNCPKCGKYFVKKQILTRHYMMFCTGTLPPPEPVIIPKVEPVDPAEKPAVPAAAATVAERRKRRVAFAEPELPKEEREIPFPPPLEPEAPTAAPTPTPNPVGRPKKSKKDSTPNVTIKPILPPPGAQTEKITSLLTTGAKLDQDSDINTINNLLSSVTEAIASISEAKAKKKKKKKEKNKEKPEAEAETPAVEAPKAASSKPKEPTPAPPAPPSPPPVVEEEKTEEEREAYALAQEVGEMTLDQQLAFCSGKLPLVVLAKTTFKQEYTEIDTEESQMQVPMEEGEADHTAENGDEGNDGYDDGGNDYSGFQDDDDDDEQQQPEATHEEEPPPAEDSQQTEELQFPMPIKQEVEPEEARIAPEEPQQEEPQVSRLEAPQPEKQAQPPVVQLPKPSEEPEPFFDEHLAINIKKEPGLEEEEVQEPAAKRKRPESRASAVASPASSLSSSRSAPQESPKLILKITKSLLNTGAESAKAIKTIVLGSSDDEDEEDQRIPESEPAKKTKVYKKPDFLAVKIKQEKVDPAYESPDPTVVVHQTELPGGIRIKQERLDPDEEPPQAEEEEVPAPPPQKKSRLSHKEKPASPVVAFDGVRIKQEKPDTIQPVAVEMPSPVPTAESPKPQEKKKKTKGKINPFALLRQKMAAEAAAKAAEAAAAPPPQAPSPLPVITNVVGNAPTPATSSSSNSSSGENTPMVESDNESERRVPVIAQVASIAASKVSAPESPVIIKQEPVDEPEEAPEEEHEQQQEEAAEEESPNQEAAENDFPMPIKQEAPEEPTTTPEEESPNETPQEEPTTPEEESPNEAEEEPEFPMPIKQEVNESQPEEAANEESAETSEEEAERRADDKPVTEDGQGREQEPEVSSATNGGQTGEDQEDEEEDAPSSANEEPNKEEDQDEDDDQDDEADSVQPSAGKEDEGSSAVVPEQDKENPTEEEDEEDDGEEEEEESASPAAKENETAVSEEQNKEDQDEEDEDEGDDEEDEGPSVAPATGEEQTKEDQNEEEEDDGEEEEEESPIAAATVSAEQNREDQNEEDEDEDEEEEDESSPQKAEEEVGPPATNEEQNQEHEDEGEDEEEKENASVAVEEKSAPPAANEGTKAEEDQGEGDEPEGKEQDAAQQRLSVEEEKETGIEDKANEEKIGNLAIESGSTEHKQDDQNQPQSNEEHEDPTSPISDIPMDEYDQNSQEPEPPAVNERLPAAELFRPHELEAHKAASSEQPQKESSSTFKPSSTSEESSDTRLESQLEELQNLLTGGLKALPDSSQFDPVSSFPTASNDQSMVQSSSIGSSVDQNVGIGGLDVDLDSLLNNKLEEITAAQPMNTLAPQDDINLAIERELLHEMMPIGPEISATSDHGTNSLLGVGQDLLLDGSGHSAHHSSS